MKIEKTIFFIKWLQQRQQVLICALAAVLVLGFVFVRYLPLKKNLKAVRSEIAEAQTSVDNFWIQQKQLPVLKEQLLSMQQKAQDYENLVPEQRNLGDFLQQMANLKNKHNLSEQLIQPGSEIKASALNCIPLDMKCKGTLVQMFEFYKSLQSLDRQIRIESLMLDNESDFSGQLSMETKMMIYYTSKSGGIIDEY